MMKNILKVANIPASFQCHFLFNQIILFKQRYYRNIDI